jgi:hypothetical protein
MSEAASRSTQHDLIPALLGVLTAGLITWIGMDQYRSVPGLVESSRIVSGNTQAETPRISRYQTR